MRAWVGVMAALAVCGWAGAAGAADTPAHKVSLSRMAAQIPEGTLWAKLQANGLLGCGNLRQLSWGAKDNGAIKDAEYERAFRETLAAAGYQVAGDPTNLFEQDDKSGDLQVGALITGVSATFCANQMAGYFEIKGSADMTVEWQVYSAAQGKVVARIPTTGRYETKTGAQKGDTIILHRAFAANVRALAESPEFHVAVTATAIPAATASLPPISIRTAPAGAHRALNEASSSVATVLTGSGWGSAFLISSDGYLLTNQHVVGDATQVRVRWSDKTETVANVVRTDRRRDVALLRAEPGARAALPLRVGFPSPGEGVAAIGTPLEKDFQNTITKGVVSASRMIDGLSFIQSDVAVDHGNSGGPLLDDQGRVVAITDWGYAPDGVSHNLNFFIPIDDALKALALSQTAMAEPPVATKAAVRRKR